MNVAFVLAFLAEHYGGVPRVALSLGEALVRLGHSVSYRATGTDDDRKEFDYRLKGAKFAGLTARHNQQNISGVLLDELDQRSRLAREGLVEGDIITGVNRKRVHNLDDFRNALEQTRSSILLQINRRGRAYIVRID